MTGLPSIGKPERPVVDPSVTADELNDAMATWLFGDPPTDVRLAAAFRAVPRHAFVPDAPLEAVYAAHAILTKIDDGAPVSSSSEPAIMALMLAQLDVQTGHRVLEIGAGTGYNAALLDQLAGPVGSVTTIDLDEDLTAQARAALAQTGHGGVRVLTGDGWLGDQAAAPFDRIIVTVGVSDLSPHWTSQLAPDGVLVVPLWLSTALSLSIAFIPDAAGGLRSTSTTLCGFMRLRGEHAGPDRYVRLGSGFLSVELLDGAHAETIPRLTDEEPRVTSAPPVDAAWAIRFAFEQAGAVGGGMGGTVGVFVPEDESLALLHDERMHAWGGQTAERILREAASRPGRPFRLDQAKVRAVRSLTEAAVPGQPTWTIRRPNYTFGVSVPEA